MSLFTYATVCLCVYLFVCLFGVYRPTQEVFTHMETSPLQVKGCKFWPMLDIHSHWVVRVLQRATPTTTCTQDIRLYWSSPRTRDTHTYYRAFSSGAVTTSFNDLGLSRLGFEHPTQPSACGVNALTHCAPAAPAAIGTACS